MVWERGLRLGPLDFKVCITVCSPLLLPSSGEGVGFCECSQTWGSRTMAVSALGMHLPGGVPSPDLAQHPLFSLGSGLVRA